MDRESLIGELRERVKELTLLHSASRLLQAERPIDAGLIEELAALIPGAFQYPEVCAARVAWGDIEGKSRGWRTTPRMLSSRFAAGGKPGCIEIAYVDGPVMALAKPFLEEEQTLLASLTDMIRGYLDHQGAIGERRLLEQQLMQAQKMEAIGQLASGVAHDFNNLLTIILGYSELLLDLVPKDDPKREFVEEIEKAAHRSAGLTGQLLAFSRQQVTAPRVLDLNAVVHDVERMLQRVIGEDVVLTASLQPEIGSVFADQGQIEQILLNLAVNARDAMPRGGNITIETRNVALDEQYAKIHPPLTAGPYVMLAVSDNGSGMPPEVRQRIFEPFFTTKGPGKGTGLGLAVVYGIVKQSGGHLDVYSEPGLGTAFKIYLPQVDQRAKTVSVADLPPPRGSETILIIEDDIAVRALTTHALATCGYTVLEAAGGDEALRIATDSRDAIHLIVTDVVMRGESGRVIAERIVQQRPATKVLYVSGYTDDAIIRHGILYDQVAFLQKPFSPRILAHKVRDVLGPHP